MTPRAQYTAMIGTSMLLLLALAGVLLWGAYRQIATPPPFQFTQELYLPTRPDLCPGDVVEYRPRLIVTRAPALVVVARTLWGLSEGRTVVPETQPKYFVWTEADEGQPVSRVVRYQLPDDLPVGLYEIRGAATSLNSDAAAYRVPVVIAASCFKKGTP